MNKTILAIKAVLRIIYLSILLVVLILSIGYKRYYPIKGVPCINKKKLKAQDIVVLDIRNYNETTDDFSIHIINIPYAYLKRFYLEIPQGKIHVIAVDRLELNLGLRFLIKKGFIINSYELMKCPCNHKSKKGMLGYGV